MKNENLVKICLALSAVCGPASAATAKPNVLFIAVDDLNDWIGCYGWYKGKVYTPNIDKLAQQGTLFTRAYCPVSLCGPSRTALFTGKYQYSTGIYDIPQYFRQIPATKDLVTIPQYFRKNGYVAVGAGKMFHGPNEDVHDRISWDAYAEGFFGTPDPEEMPDKDLPFSNPVDQKTFHVGPILQSLEQTKDGENAAYIIDFIRQKHDKPFFAAFGCFRPHIPWYAPQKFFDLYDEKDILIPEGPENDLDDVPPMGVEVAHQLFHNTKDGHPHKTITDAGLWKRYIHGYLACISFADACVGQVLDALEASPYADNTIIVFWSDNGWHLGDKEHWHKHSLWERGARVPLIIKAPGITGPGTRTDVVANLVDLYPTLVDLCGLPPFEQLEGESLVPALKKPDIDWKRTVVTSFPWNKNSHTIVDDRYRYIRYADGSEELYDHKNDWTEWTNLAGNPEYDDIKQRLKQKLLETVK